MKVLTATAFIFAGFLFAQLPAHAQLQAGLRLGVNMAQIQGEHVKKSDGGISYQAGIFTRFAIKGIPFQPELLSSGRTYKFKQEINENDVYSSVDKEIKATYLELPVLLVFDLGEKFDLVLGPYVSFRTSLSQTLGNGAKTDGYELDGGDFGLTGGFAYFLDNGIDFSLRGQYGLTGFSKVNENLPGPRYLEMRNMCFQFTVGLPVSGSGKGDEIPKTYKESY